MISHLIRMAGACAVSACLASTLAAAPRPIGPHARLQRCGAGTCLLVSGHRSDLSAPVALAGHDVAVRGGRAWRVALPLATVRAWSAPFARSIAVRVGGKGGGEAGAPLPIGLLGAADTLAFLDVSAGH